MGPMYKLFFGNLMPFKHRHKLILFSHKSMGNIYEKVWCLLDMNLGMCIKEYSHNSYHFQKKKHMFKSKMCGNIFMHVHKGT
jgi:hypothetical protein